jgi:hypothetical protein
MAPHDTRKPLPRLIRSHPPIAVVEHAADEHLIAAFSARRRPRRHLAAHARGGTPAF